MFKFANGDWYEGTWSEGKPNGQGRVEYASGDVYEGHFKDHLKHGFGIFTFTSGCQVRLLALLVLLVYRLNLTGCHSMKGGI